SIRRTLLRARFALRRNRDQLTGTRAGDDTDQQRTRNRAEGIAPRHTFELGREGLGVLLGRGGKLGSRIRNSASGTADLGGDRLAHAASGFCPLAADL